MSLLSNISPQRGDPNLDQRAVWNDDFEIIDQTKQLSEDLIAKIIQRVKEKLAEQEQS